MTRPTTDELYALAQTASAAVADLTDAVTRAMRRQDPLAISEADFERLKAHALAPSPWDVEQAIRDISHAAAPSPTVTKGADFDEPLPPAPWLVERHPCCRAVVGRGHLSDCAVAAIAGGDR